MPCDLRLTPGYRWADLAPISWIGCREVLNLGKQPREVTEGLCCGRGMIHQKLVQSLSVTPRTAYSHHSRVYLTLGSDQGRGVSMSSLSHQLTPNRRPSGGKGQKSGGQEAYHMLRMTSFRYPYRNPWVTVGPESDCHSQLGGLDALTTNQFYGFPGRFGRSGL